MSQGKAEARKEQNDAKTKTTKSKGDEADSPGKILVGGLVVFFEKDLAEDRRLLILI